jgi:hypothetical protein
MSQRIILLGYRRQNTTGWEPIDGSEGLGICGPKGQIFPASANQLAVFSDAGEDAGDGIGARIVRVYGLDSNYRDIYEDVVLDGTNPVITAKSFLRVQVVEVTEVGATKLSVGVISVTDKDDPSLLYAKVAIAEFASYAVAYTVPAGKEVRMGEEAFFWSNYRTDFELQFNLSRATFRASNFMVTHDIISHSREDSGPVLIKMPKLVLPARTDIRMKARRIGGSSPQVGVRMPILVA